MTGWAGWVGFFVALLVLGSATGLGVLYERARQPWPWAEPEGEHVKLLGHRFRVMDPSDYDAFAGAPEHAMICYCRDGTVLIWGQTEDLVHEVLPSREMSLTELGETWRDWKMKAVG